MGIVMPVLTNEKRSMPRLLISVVFLLTWTKKEAQIAKTAAGYDLLREKKLMENKIEVIYLITSRDSVVFNLNNKTRFHVFSFGDFTTGAN